MSDLIATNANGDIYLNRFHLIDGLVIDIQEMVAEDLSGVDFVEAKKFVSSLNRCEMPSEKTRDRSWSATIPDVFSIGRVVLRRAGSYRRCIVLNSEFVAKHFAKMLSESTAETHKVWNGLIASGLDERRYVIAPVGEMLG